MPIKKYKGKFRKKDSTILFENQIAVLEYTAHGFSSDEVAHIMEVSIRTVESQRAIIVRKLKTRNMYEAIAVGMKNNLIKHDPSQFKKAIRILKALKKKKP